MSSSCLRKKADPKSEARAYTPRQQMRAGGTLLLKTMQQTEQRYDNYDNNDSQKGNDTLCLRLPKTLLDANFTARTIHVKDRFNRFTRTRTKLIINNLPALPSHTNLDTTAGTEATHTTILPGGRKSWEQ